MKTSDFAIYGRHKIGGKYRTVKKYRHGNWWRVGSHNLRAETFEEAVEKFNKAAETVKI